jgi:hypothetical protein
MRSSLSLYILFYCVALPWIVAAIHEGVAWICDSLRLTHNSIVPLGKTELTGLAAMSVALPVVVLLAIAAYPLISGLLRCRISI